MSAEAVVVGAGWAGSIVAAELTRAGIDVTLIEQGADTAAATSADSASARSRPDPRTSRTQASAWHARETITVRHRLGETALPIRQGGSFLTVTGVGGGGSLWGGMSPRIAASALAPLSSGAEAYDPAGLPTDHLISDWPISWPELERGLAKFESEVGVAGLAGNLDGHAGAGGDRFEGPRSAAYPLRPGPTHPLADRFRDGARSTGLHPFPLPTTQIDGAYRNPFGIERRPEHGSGFSLATPANTVLPSALQTGRLTVLTDSHVTRLLHDGTQITGVRYVDEQGEHDKPAEIVVLAAWTFANTRLLLLSKIGTPYEPWSGRGSVGRAYSYHLGAAANGLFTRLPDSITRATSPVATGWAVSDLDVDGSARDRPFAGGVFVSSVGSGSVFPDSIALPAGSDRWGPGWRQALRRHAGLGVRASVLVEGLPRAKRFLDLDPTYRDAWGDPLLRATFDWDQHERSVIHAISPVLERIVRSAGADIVLAPTAPGSYDAETYQNSHPAGGTVAGVDPDISVVDPTFESWQVANLWIAGASTFPTGPAPNPTPTVAAIAYLTAAAVIARVHSARVSTATSNSTNQTQEN